MKKKRFLAGVLSAAMALSVAVVNPTVVKADGWLDDVKDIEFGVSYSDNFTYDDYNFHPDRRSDTVYYDSYKIDVPEDGNIVFSFESADKLYSSSVNATRLDIYKIDDVDKAVCSERLDISSYSSARGVYYIEDLKISLTKGTYYVALNFDLDSRYDPPTESYSFTIDYNASVATTRFKSAQKTKKGLSLTWNRVSGIDGYQIEYSTKEDFSAKKKTITIKDVKTVKQLINGIKKKKTYYVRIRSYKYVKVNGVKEQFFSDWSETSSL